MRQFACLTLWDAKLILRHLRLRPRRSPGLKFKATISRVLKVFGDSVMPNHKSAEKRMRQNERRRTINRGHRTKVRTYIKKLRGAVESGNRQEIDQLLPEAISVIDKSVQKGVLHANAASRYKSRLTVAANQASSK